MLHKPTNHQLHWLDRTCLGDWTKKQIDILRRHSLRYAYLVRPCLEVNPHDKAGLVVYEETHPCTPNFIQSIFETVQAGCINSVLVQTVLSVNDLI